MTTITVTGNQLIYKEQSYACAIGRGGIGAKQGEGDGITPIGSFYPRECWYRADLLDEPKTQLPLRVIHEDDGWCDDSTKPEYNRHITLPFAPSHEKLWRDDNTYNIIVPLSYNDAPVVPGKGSAIFLHVAKPGYSPTEGCVALAQADLLAILPYLSAQSRIEIKAE